jgi:8-oxo-dGTP pyrophosphatase MutT (NUDIX family)
MHRNKFGEQYYSLIGGAMLPNESAEQTINREVREETGLVVIIPRLVFVEQAGEPFGAQYIFLCDYRSGEVALSPESEEFKIHALGKNLYMPMWLPIKQLPDVPFVSEGLKQAVINGLARGFPEQPVEISAN